MVVRQSHRAEDSGLHATKRRVSEPLKQRTETRDLVADAVLTHRVPVHGRIGADDGFAEPVLSLRGNPADGDRQAKQHDRAGVGPIDVLHRTANDVFGRAALRKRVRLKAQDFTDGNARAIEEIGDRRFRFPSKTGQNHDRRFDIRRGQSRRQRLDHRAARQREFIADAILQLRRRHRIEQGAEFARMI